MALSLDVSLRDAYEKFSQSNLIAQVSTGFNATTGLPQTAPNVTIDPPESDESLRRTIVWNLNANIINSDDASGWGALRQTVQALLSGITSGASAA